MTILNVEVDKRKEERIKEIAKSSVYKTISEFVRSVLDEKLKIEETSQKKSGDCSIHKWVPNGKYIAFVHGAIASIGDTISEVSRESADKFPESSVIIKKKGKPTSIPEFIFSTFTELKCWNYSIVENRSYPLLLLKIIAMARFAKEPVSK